MEWSRIRSQLSAVAASVRAAVPAPDEPTTDRPSAPDARDTTAPTSGSPARAPGAVTSPLVRLAAGAPQLDRPVLVHHLTGFIDAGSAGELAIGHLEQTLESQVVATFDLDVLLDYRSRRPAVTFDADHYSAYDAPRLTVSAVRDAVGTEFLLLAGPEPDHQWEGFAQAVTQLVEHFGVSLTIGVHGIPMAVPHTRPTGVTLHGSRPELVDQKNPWAGELQVPGSAGALLELRLGEAGHDAMGWAAHVPHYLSQSEYPDAAGVLLERLADRTGLVLPLGDLLQAAQATQQRIEEEVRGSEEVGRVVKALETQYDAFARGRGRDLLEAPAPELPSADEIGAEFERFLSSQTEAADGGPAADGTDGDRPAADPPGADGPATDGPGGDDHR